MAAEIRPSEPAVGYPPILSQTANQDSNNNIQEKDRTSANHGFFSDPEDGVPEDAQSDHNSNRTTLLGDETYPEGGKAAWLVVLGAWCASLGSLGVMNTIGTYQTYTENHQLAQYDSGTIGWIFSLYTALTFSGGMVIGPLFDKFGPRWLILSGTICVAISMQTMTIYTEYWHFILGFSLLCGLGSSLLFTPSVASVGHFFKRRRGLATGIASTGSGIGGIIFPLMNSKLFESMGWAWAIRIQGLITLGLLVVANCLVRKRLPPAKNATSKPDFRILGNKAFALLTLGVFLLEFGLFIPIAYISSYALDQGFSESFSFAMLPIFNAGSVLGRVFPGWLGDIIGPYNSNMMSLAIGTFSSLVIWLPFGHTTPGLVIFALLFGFSSGNNISITPVCVGKLCETQEYGRYYATCYTVAAVACLIGIPIAGSVVGAQNGQYWGMIILTGGVEFLGMVAIYLSKVSIVGWDPRIIF